jgi:serine/threonine-protein kinase
MGATSKKPVRDHVMGARPITRSGCNTERLRRVMRTALLPLALLSAIAFLAPPATAKAAAKKGVHGAIALQRETGQFGYAYNAATSRAAKTEALNQCADPHCEVVVNFRNACGALARQPARGPRQYFPAAGAVRQEAETKALRLCAARECEIVAWACTK